MTPLRVVHMGTGATGVLALRQVLQHPDLELVGLRVTTSAKAGVDAGVLAGVDPVGVTATEDLDQVLALGADCLSYCAKGSGREPEAAADIGRFLERGTNAVTHSLISMHYPTRGPDAIREVLADACARGQTSFFNSGVEPGVMSGQMLVSALSFAGRVDQVEITEFGDPRNYAVPEVARESMGFGMPADYVPPRFTGGGVLAWWRPVADFAAHLIGVDLDDYVFTWDTATSEKGADTAFGRIEAGTIGATLWEIQGSVRGRCPVIVRHVSAVQPCTKAGWPTLPAGAKHTAYQIKVHGELTYTVNVLVDPNADTGLDTAIATTATHTVNAIPTVCAAAPGVLDQITVGAFSSRVLGTPPETRRN